MILATQEMMIIGRDVQFKIRSNGKAKHNNIKFNTFMLNTKSTIVHSSATIIEKSDLMNKQIKIPTRSGIEGRGNLIP